MRVTAAKNPLQSFVRRFTVALVIVVVLATTGISYATWFYSNAVANDPHHLKLAVDPTQSGQPVNYLIVGSDSRAFVHTAQEARQFGSASSQTGQRSDTMIIAHLDPSKKQAYVVSVPRDLYVTFPGGCHAKINAAFNSAFHCEGSPYYGGPDQLIRVMKQDFGIPINHYLSVDFESFKGIVDAIGTVDLYIPTVAQDTETGLFVSTPGCNAFNGTRALQYVRSRHYEYKLDYRQPNWIPDNTGDLGRIRRQQYFIRSLAQAAIHRGMSNVATAITIMHKALKSLTVEAGFDSNDLSLLVTAFHNTDPKSIEMATLPADLGTSPDGQSILRLRAVDAAPIFARLRNVQPPAPIKPPAIPPSTVTVDVANGNGVSGEASQTVSQLESYGFVRGTIADAPSTSTTMIYYAPGEATDATLVQAYLGGVGRPAADSSLPQGTVRVVLGGDFSGVSSPASASHTAKTTTTTAAPDPSAKGSKPQPLVGCG